MINEKTDSVLIKTNKLNKNKNIPINIIAPSSII